MCTVYGRKKKRSDLDMNANKQAPNSIARVVCEDCLCKREIGMETIMRIRLRWRKCECDGYDVSCD